MATVTTELTTTVQATEKDEDVSSDEENLTNPMTEEELEEMRHFYPDDDALAAAQQDDPEWNSKREQLQLLLSEPKHLLNEAYMKKLGIGERRIKELSHLEMVGNVLCHVPLPRQFYQADGTAKVAMQSTAPLNPFASTFFLGGIWKA